MEIKGMVQGSDEWHEFRKTHIGASEAAIIMGVGFITPLQLFCQKMGVGKQYVSDAMRRGIELEPQARASFTEMTGYDVSPAVYVSDVYPWMSASLDGISLDETIAVEIKCPGERDHTTAKNGRIPEKYMPQLQHQMFVCNLDRMFYFSFDGQNGHLLTVLRDDSYIEDLVGKEAEFYRRLIEFDPPDDSAHDWVVSHDSKLSDLLHRYFIAKEEMEGYKDLMDAYKDQLIEHAAGNNVKCSGMKIQKVVSRGRIDYDAIEILHGFDLNPYRKKPSESWYIKRDNGK